MAEDPVSVGSEVGNTDKSQSGDVPYGLERKNRSAESEDVEKVVAELNEAITSREHQVKEHQDEIDRLNGEIEKLTAAQNVLENKSDTPNGDTVEQHATETPEPVSGLDQNENPPADTSGDSSSEVHSL